MRYYCDASLIVAVLVSEVHSAAARAWLGDVNGAELAISSWVMTEVASALAQKQRMGALSLSERARVQRVWVTAFAGHLPLVEVIEVDFARAATLVDAGRRGLRGGDALHLAIAERNGLAVATLDTALFEAAISIGLPVPTIRTDA